MAELWTPNKRHSLGGKPAGLLERGHIGGWNPGKRGEPLAPPGFVPQRRIIGHADYVKDHPTRYNLAKHIQPLARKLYRELGGPEQIHINTYIWHPPFNAAAQILRNYQMYMFDVWNGAGRGAPIDFWKGEKAVEVVWNDPGEPFLWYYIWRGLIYNRFIDDFAPRFFASEDDLFNFHGDHPHFGFLLPGGVWF
jgi:hypothetical protein